MTDEITWTLDKIERAQKNRAIDRFAPAAGNRDRTTEGEEPCQARTARARIVAEYIPPPSRERPFWLFGVDTTPNPRPFAATLPDRWVVYRPNPAPGNKPIVVGHTYSVAALLPELSGPRSAVGGASGLPTCAHREEGHRGGRRADRRIAEGPIAPLRHGVERGSRRLPLQSCLLSAYDRRLRQSCRHRAQRWQPGLEHFFRFAKQRLLLDKFRTPEVVHEECWWQLVCLAYIQLRLAAPLANVLPKPWERYLPESVLRARFPRPLGYNATSIE